MNLAQKSNAELSKELRGSMLRGVPKLLDSEQLAHDLSVYQIEREIQNRELREAQRELELSRENYAELYDFAPVVYLNFDDNATICSVNLAGVSFLKKNMPI